MTLPILPVGMPRLGTSRRPILADRSARRWPTSCSSRSVGRHGSCYWGSPFSISSSASSVRCPIDWDQAWLWSVADRDGRADPQTGPWPAAESAGGQRRLCRCLGGGLSGSPFRTAGDETDPGGIGAIRPGALSRRGVPLAVPGSPRLDQGPVPAPAGQRITPHSSRGTPVMRGEQLEWEAAGLFSLNPTVVHPPIPIRNANESTMPAIFDASASEPESSVLST